ncbi:Uncharacterised protein [Bordetella pertussis]|nr:Uncharacterised protein [Bordetella pertussis]CFW43889.1 Uncharacterised protein [Bordetella pertussis]
MAWFTVMLPAVPSSRVYPSGVARETCSVPMLPPAPALFSTMTGWPSLVPMCWPTSRAIRSVVPPAAYGTMRRMGCAG